MNWGILDLERRKVYEKEEEKNNPLVNNILDYLNERMEEDGNND